jgi:deoxyribose-phosphate aldolase
MDLTGRDIARMVDLSAVQANDNEMSIESLVETASRYHCLMVETLPSQTAFVKELLRNVPDVGFGGNVGFPSGGQTTRIKVAETRDLLELGCQEIDVVINIAQLLSGNFKYVLDDLQAVVLAAEGIPVKAILECHYLPNELIKKACDICIEAEASWVKTGTGWTISGATPENITLIKSHVGELIGIKAAGGIRGIDMLLDLYRRGARRFGIGLRWGKQILEESTALLGDTAGIQQ